MIPADTLRCRFRVSLDQEVHSFCRSKFEFKYVKLAAHFTRVVLCENLSIKRTTDELDVVLPAKILDLCDYVIDTRCVLKNLDCA